MIQRLVSRFLPRGAVILSVLVFGSYLLGLVRDRMFARTFGAGHELDAYNAAFVLPELALDVVVASGLAAPFIPIFLGLRADGEDADAFAQTILTAAVGVMTIAAGLMFIFAPQTTALIAPGFDAQQRELYIGLFRVMLLTPIIFAASLSLGEVLLADQRFVPYGSAPLLYNAGIIVGTVALSAPLGIFGPAIGAVIGALLHLGVRLWGLWGSGFRIRPRWAIHTRAVRDFVRLMLPKMASHPVEPLTFLFFTSVATTLAAGSVTAVSFARNFQSVPVSIIGISFATAAFPTLSAAYAVGNRREFGTTLVRNLLVVTVLTTAAAAVLLAVGALAIEILLGGGAFDAEDVALTAGVLAVFAVAIPFESATHILSRAIYATRHTLLQVLSSLAAFGVTIGVTLALAPAAAVTAIPIGFAAGMVVRVVLLALSLAWRLRRWDAAQAVGMTTTNLSSRSG